MGYKKQIGRSFIFKFLNIAFVFLSAKLISEHYGLEVYGQWSVILSVFTVASFLNFGLAGSIQNEVLNTVDAVELKKSITSLLLINTFISIVPSFLYYSFSSFFSSLRILHIGINESMIVILIIGMLVFSSGFVRIYLAQSRSDMAEAYSLFISLFFLGFLSFPCFFEGFRHLGFILHSYFISVVVSVVIFSINPIKTYFIKINIQDIFDSFAHIRVGLLFFFAQIFSFILYSSDRIIIYYILGAENTAIFDLYYRFFMLFLTLATLLQRPLWSIFGSARDDTDYLIGIFKKINYYFAFFVPLTRTCPFRSEREFKK